MEILLRSLPSTVNGPARMKYVAPEAYDSLMLLERDTGGLVYTNFWWDAVATLEACRLRKTCAGVGLSLHNYGLAFDIDLRWLDDKKVSYEDLLYLMKRRGWFSHRRDGDVTKPEAGHFNYLGDHSAKYLLKVTHDPTTWQLPAEERIFEKYGESFKLDTAGVQEHLSKLGFLHGPCHSGTMDTYTREGVRSFQRAYDLPDDGVASLSFCRVLVFVSASLTFSS
jgi:peptidoglycan hydrolase-like protein with peptidoglycan-binding domain